MTRTVRALDDGRGDPRDVDGLPRRHDHEPRPAAHRRGAPGHHLLEARGPDLRRQRLPRDPRRAAHPRRRARRLLRPAADLRDRPHRASGSPRSCAAWRRRSSCSSSPGCSRAPPGRCSCPARSRSSRRCSRARRAPARSASGRRRHRRPTLLGPVIGGLLVDSVSWRAAFLINVPLVLARPVRDHPLHARDARSEERVRHVRLAGRGRRRDRRRRARVRRDPRPGPQLAGPGRVGRAGHRRGRPRRVPVPHGAPARTRSSRSGCSGAGSSRRSTSRRC